MKNLPYLLIIFCLLVVMLGGEIYAQWVPTERFPSGSGGVNALAISGTNIFAGTGTGGVFLTTDAGMNWIEVNSGLTNKEIWSLGVSGSNVFAGTSDGVFLTANNGTSWDEVNSGLPDNTTVYSFAVSGSNIFVGTDDGVFLSNDNGSSWTEKNSGLPNTWARALIVSGSNIFASVGFSVFVSNDNGSNWTEVNSGLSTNLTIYSLAVSGDNIFVGTNGGGIYLSVDNGANWDEINTNLTEDVIWNFAVSGSNVFAGTNDGVFLTTDNGANWTSTEYDYISAYALTVSETELFAGGGFTRVYKRPLSELVTDVEVNSDIIPLKFYLHQNYPNPFNPTTNIGFRIAESGLVTLKIYDTLGNEIVTLVNEEKQAGNYKVTFDASELSSGVYFYKLTSTGLVETKKMVLLH